MSVLDEVWEWENSLKQQLIQLKFCEEKVKSDERIKKALKDRFFEIIQSLKMNMIQIMARCTQLRGENLNRKAQGIRADRLRKEYNNAIKNLKKLMCTTKVQKRDKTPKRPRSVIEQRDQNSTVHNIVGRELTKIKDTIGVLQNQIKMHSHKQYEERIRFLEKDNKTLRQQIEGLQEDQLDIMRNVRELKEYLQSRSGTQASIDRNSPNRFSIGQQSPQNNTIKQSRPRFMLKATMEAEKAFVR